MNSIKRSFREAFVGFSILGGMILLSGLTIWLKGIRINSKNWIVYANFDNASGLTERSPITYRGIHIGSVGQVIITPEKVQATLEINKPELLLPKPVFAKVVNSSLLGGDVQLALIATGKAVSKRNILPSSEDCPSKIILCKGDTIEGKPLSSIASLTEELEKIIKKAGKENVVTNLVDSTKQFDRTQYELEQLILDAKAEIQRARPIIEQIEEASIHLNKILSAIDNPETLEDIKGTVNNTRSLTEKIDSLSSEMQRLVEDEELMAALRKVTIGLGELFNEIYPSKLSQD